MDLSIAGSGAARKEENPPVDYRSIKHFPPDLAGNNSDQSVVREEAKELRPLSRERDYLAYSIVTTLFCCLPIGIAALVYSSKTRKANLQGDVARAVHTSDRTLILNRIALGLGSAIFLALAAYLIFGILAQWDFYRDPSTYAFYKG